MNDLRPLADLIAVGADTPASIQQTRSTTRASFPLLRDPGLVAAKIYDMQLRANWPMGMMGNFPEMGYVIVDQKGIIRAQRVDLNFGDHAGDIVKLLGTIQ